MIVQKDCYECPECQKWYFFITTEQHSTICPKCNCEIKYLKTYDCDTERKVTYCDASFYSNKPTITCPYCQSTNTEKISATGRILSTGLFGLGSSKVGKQWHCKKCKSDF